MTIVGTGNVGSALAHRLAVMDIADEIVLVDEKPGLAEGVALDLNHAAVLEGYRTHFVGTTSDGYDATTDSALIVLLVGRSVSAEDAASGDIYPESRMRQAAVGVLEAGQRAADASPDAVLFNMTGPIIPMTTLAQKSSGLPHARVFGQDNLSLTAAAKRYLARQLNVPARDIDFHAFGCHGHFIAALSHARVQGRPLRDVATDDQITKALDRSYNGLGEIVRFQQSFGPRYTPAAAGARFIEAVLTDSKAMLPTCAYAKGIHGLDGDYVGTLCVIGSSGVEGFVDIELSEKEDAELHNAIRAQEIHLEKFVDLLE